ncbi:hypothetical protein QP116_01850 [Pseudoglutamicibacter cumminsii]|uniref:Peptidoglycan binding-like domain-containing protein n=1 Tax=Pseudoglutamicibacter cumminsii TaxID=156979 RepID=A0AAP4FG50_9MICC|nr:hypothetical protein [Pseudoglutamicibacter cumminsii]MDK6274497.1 hypothetical protein [Pseudoglutamicibacter cumminsii]
MKKAGAPHLSRVAFPVRTLVITVVVIGAVVAAFFIGTLTAPKSSVATVTDEKVQATAVVEERPIVPDTVILGAVGEGKTRDVLPTVLPETPTVTKQALKKGKDVVPGQLLGSVAGTPVFAVSGQLPLYRDLAAGDKGDDVIAFQKALETTGYNVPASGVVDATTINAVAALFREAGYALPQRETDSSPSGPSDESATEEDGSDQPAAPQTQPYIPVAAFASIGGKSGTVLSVAGVSSTLGPEQPFAKIRVGSRTIKAYVNVADAQQLKKGTEVRIIAGAATFAGTVENVGEFEGGTDSRAPGHQVSFATKDEAFEKVQTGTQVRVELTTKAKPQKAVPVTALRHDADGDYVLVTAPGSRGTNGQGSKNQGSNDKEEPRRVKVTVGKTAAGWAAVESDDLAVGDTVVL